MRPQRHVSFLAGLFVAVCCVPAAAGPLFPCVRAVSSKNGAFVVIVDSHFESALENSGRPHYIFLNVFPREGFINAKDELAAPATYWTDAVRWAVVLDSSNIRNEPACPLPLISNDGEFLILLHLGPTFSAGGEVLQIYRRRDHPGELMKEGPDHGVFVKSLSLADIWPAEKLAANSGVWTDETPEWFAGGNFEFSADGLQLIHKTRWGNTIRINLGDGSLEKQ